MSASGARLLAVLLLLADASPAARLLVSAGPDVTMGGASEFEPYADADFLLNLPHA